MRTSSGDGALSGLTKEERQKPRGQIGHAENSLFLEENYEITNIYIRALGHKSNIEGNKDIVIITNEQIK